MKFRYASSSCFALALATAACGGEKPQPVAPVAPAPVAPAVDMSPVPAPATLLGWGRASDPSRLVGTAFGFVGLPAPGGEALGELLEMKDVAAVADMKAPLEAAVFLVEGRTPKPRVLVSIPVVSEADAKQKLAQYKLSEAGGITVLSFDKGAGQDAEAQGAAASDKLCILAPAKGKPDHRLVCGRKDTLDQYAPFMTRTLPTIPSQAPIYGELYMKPVRGPARDLARMANSLKILFDAPEFSGLVDLAVQAAGDAVDLTQDLDTAFLKADVDDKGVHSTLGLRFASSKSTTASFILAHPERAATPPVGLESTPKDPGFAVFTHGLDLAPLDKALGQLHDKLTEIAKTEKFPEAERTQLDDLLSRTKAYLNHSVVSTRGADDAAVEKALSAYSPDKASGAAGQKLRFAAADALQGWHAYRSDVAPAEMVKLSADWGKLLASPALKKWLGSELAKGDKDKGASSDIKKVLDLFGIKVKTTKAPASYGLPAGTDLVEITLPRFAALAAADADLSMPPPPPAAGKKPVKVAKPAPLPKPSPVVYKMFVTADGTGSISVYSADAKLAADKLKEAMAKGGGQSDAIKTLGQMKASGGGYVSLRAGASIVMDGMLQSGAVGERQLGKLRKASRTDGVFFSWKSIAPSTGSAGGSFEIGLDVPAKTLVSGISLAR